MTKVVLFPEDPISRIEWRHVDELTANNWNPNVCYTPEFKLLEHSVLSSGWLQPILVNTEGIIIDGFHRYTLAKTSKALRAKYQGLVPCAVMPITEGEAMMMTVRINRAKGSHLAVRMSSLVKALVDVHGYTFEQIAPELGALVAEVELLYQDDLFKAKKLDQLPYSLAWVPAESRDKSMEHPKMGTQETMSTKFTDAPEAAPDTTPAVPAEEEVAG